MFAILKTYLSYGYQKKDYSLIVEIMNLKFWLKQRKYQKLFFI